MEEVQADISTTDVEASKTVKEQVIEKNKNLINRNNQDDNESNTNNSSLGKMNKETVNIDEKLHRDLDKIPNADVNLDLPNDKYEPLSTDSPKYEQVDKDSSVIETSDSDVKEIDEDIPDLDVVGGSDNEKSILKDVNISPDDLKEGDVEDECLKQNDEVKTEPSKAEDEWLDVLGSGQLRRKVLKKGNGGNKPIHGDIVTVSSEGRLSDGTIVDKEESVTFTLGDGDVIQAWDLGVSLMEVGEIIELITEPRFAYGKLGREPDIPKDATITYTLELLKKDYPLDLTKLSVEDRMQAGEKKRERGNYYFSRSDHTSAMTSYNKALKILDLESFSDAGTGDIQELQKILDSRVKCYNNLAACQLKVEAYDMVIKSCQEVLNLSPENVKAFFRIGKAYAGKGDTQKAVDFMKRALKLEPETKVIHQELSKLTKKLKVETQSEKNMYRKMLGTDTVTEKKPKAQSNNLKWIGVAGAVTAVLVSAGIAMYKFGHS